MENRKSKLLCEAQVRSICMLKARRQRSSWARIKLSNWRSQFFRPTSSVSYHTLIVKEPRTFSSAECPPLKVRGDADLAESASWRRRRVKVLRPSA